MNNHHSTRAPEPGARLASRRRLPKICWPIHRLFSQGAAIVKPSPIFRSPRCLHRLTRSRKTRANRSARQIQQFCGLRRAKSDSLVTARRVRDSANLARQNPTGLRQRLPGARTRSPRSQGLSGLIRHGFEFARSRHRRSRAPLPRRQRAQRRLQRVQHRLRPRRIVTRPDKVGPPVQEQASACCTLRKRDSSIYTNPSTPTRQHRPTQSSPKTFIEFPIHEMNPEQFRNLCPTDILTRQAEACASTSY